MLPPTLSIEPLSSLQNLHRVSMGGTDGTLTCYLVFLGGSTYETLWPDGTQERLSGGGRVRLKLGQTVKKVDV